MFKVLLVTAKRDHLENLGSSLAQHHEVQLSWAGSGQEALDYIRDTPPDLVITDEKVGDMTGLEMVSKIVSINFMVNYAVVSSLSSDAFHEAGEGLGILAKLPVHPGPQYAEGLLDRLKEIQGLSSSTTSKTS